MQWTEEPLPGPPATPRAPQFGRLQVAGLVVGLLVLVLGALASYTVVFLAGYGGSPGFDHFMTIVFFGGGLTGACAAGVWRGFGLPPVPERLGVGVLAAVAPLSLVPVAWFLNVGRVSLGALHDGLTYVWLVSAWAGFSAATSRRGRTPLAVLLVVVASLYIPDHHVGFRLERGCFEDARDAALTEAEQLDAWHELPREPGRCGPVAWSWIEVESGGVVWFREAEPTGWPGGYAYKGDGPLTRGCAPAGCAELIDLGGGWWAYRPDDYIG